MTKHNWLTATKLAKILASNEYGDWCDGHGGWLQGSPKYQTWSWALRFTSPETGKKRTMGLGAPPDVGLAKFRERRQAGSDLLFKGIDPIEERKRRIEAAKRDEGSRLTFKDAAKAYHEQRASTWSGKYAKQWLEALENHAFKTLGSRPIAALDAMVINDALRNMTQRVTADRTKSKIEMVCQWVKDGKPPPKGATTVEHHEAMPYADLPGFMSDLRDVEDLRARALELLILTATRTGETLGATWAEIDLDAATWTIPASRMKGGVEHVVPLSSRVVEILNELPDLDSPYLFPGKKADARIYDKAMANLLAKLRPGLTVHGFRSTFSDWAGDQTNASAETREFCLAHKVPDKTVAAYRRYRSLDKRRDLLEQWAGYCCGEGALAPSKIVKLSAA